MCLYLPRFMGEIDADEAPEDAVPDDGTRRAVVVIDDAATVRMLIVDVLEETEYTAIEANDGSSGATII